MMRDIYVCMLAVIMRLFKTCDVYDLRVFSAVRLNSCESSVPLLTSPVTGMAARIDLKPKSRPSCKQAMWVETFLLWGRKGLAQSVNHLYSVIPLIAFVSVGRSHDA